MSLSHAQARNYLHLAVDGLLSSKQLRELQHHLDNCGECQAYADEVTQLETLLTRSLGARWPSPRPNDPRIQRGIGKARARSGRRHWFQRVYESAQAVAWAALIVAFVVTVGWLFASVTPQLAAPPGGSATPVPTATAAPTATPNAIVEIPTPTSTDAQDQERTLNICLGAEPSTLYLYSSSTLVASHVQEAIYDGPIDDRGFSYQPVILEKLPSLADGDAVTDTVVVKAGDLVVDDAGRTVTLKEGTLIRPAGCHQPACAEAFDGTALKMERMVVTFTLKAGIQWSDGEPLTAYDSVYSFEIDRDPDTPSDKNRVNYTARYEALNDYTTVWIGLPGYRDSSYFINFWTPLPEHAWGTLTALELTEAQESTRNPLGWGPYVLEEWIPSEAIKLVKNQNYWRADEGLPKFDQVNYRFVNDNANASIVALLSGECDIVDQTAQLDNQSEMLLELQAVGKLNATFVTGTVWEHIDFGIHPVESYDRPDFFSDARVRQAIAHCLDRQAVVDAVMYGQSQVLHTYVSPEHPLYNPDVKQYPFDPNAGSTLLAAAGWVDDDGNPETPRVAQGIEGIPDGSQLSFSYWTTSAGQRQAATEILRASLAECGVQVKLEHWSPSEFFANGPDGPLFGRRFDLAQFAWLTGVEPPCDLYVTEEIPGDPDQGFCGWNCTNAPGFSHRAYDTACKAAQQSLPGTPEYEWLHKEAQRIFAEKLPAIPLYLRLKLAATRPEIRNFIMDPTASSEFWNIEAFEKVK